VKFARPEEEEIYLKAKAEKILAFSGDLYVHVCKDGDATRGVYGWPKQNDGAPGSRRRVTFEAIENARRRWLPRADSGRTEISATMCRCPASKGRKIPKERGAKSASFRFRRFGIGWWQGALKLHTGADLRGQTFQTGIVLDIVPSGQLMTAVDRVARAIVQQKTRIIDIDLRSYFDNVRQRSAVGEGGEAGFDDVDVFAPAEDHAKGQRQAKAFRKAGVISPLLSNLLPHRGGQDAGTGEKRPRATASTPTSSTQDFADDLVILIDAHPAT